MKQQINEIRRMQQLSGILIENFYLSNDKWRNWAISKNESITYNDLDSPEKYFVDQISDFINNQYESTFREYNAYKPTNSLPAMFDKQNLTVIGLNRKDIENLSDDIKNKFGDRFITADVSGNIFIERERVFPPHYKLLLDPLFIKKYEKEAYEFYDEAPKFN